ncbi:translation initiation factor IF-2 N-terminal domain-containing protein [Marinoscillum sp. MHG1-6]|uniref:translation initiation factor IF-2 N-terminal domain-containing protein n=1 Tax=Marinoscillum sp. MHG1-6 TaxID=2959627 RepID=UPI002157D086|nr:translation initiation factor IF-2 N-terminal domain-containing protein [Marinoscillum sp. MHG1-6]
MRLGQLARKFDVTPQEIISYLKTKGITANPHPNSKLDEEAEALVLEHFDILPEQPIEMESVDTAADESNVPEDLDVPISHETIDEVEDNPEEDLTVTSEVVSEPQEEVTSPIRTATVGEILESEEEGSELDVHLIKAPKVELDGLKVVGKIDLPEPKPKSETQGAEQEDRPGREQRQRGNRKPRLSEEEREKRRLKNKEWKKKREAWQAKKQKEAEEARIKAEKEAHYRTKIAQKATSPSKGKKATKKKKKTGEAVPERPQPKTALGKFWRWLNT